MEKFHGVVGAIPGLESVRGLRDAWILGSICPVDLERLWRSLVLSIFGQREEIFGQPEEFEF